MRMIKTFKFPLKFSQERETVLGAIPAGRIVKSEGIVEGGKPLWLIEVDTNPERPAFVEYWQG